MSDISIENVCKRSLDGHEVQTIERSNSMNVIFKLRKIDYYKCTVY